MRCESNCVKSVQMIKWRVRNSSPHLTHERGLINHASFFSNFATAFLQKHIFPICGNIKCYACSTVAENYSDIFYEQLKLCLYVCWEVLN